MRNSQFALPIVLVALLAASLAGCTSGGHAFNPPGGSTTFHHMYLSNAQNPGVVYMYNLPVTSSSTPAATVTGAGVEPLGLYVDARGRLFVPENGGSAVLVYTLPLTNSSTPAFTLTTSHPDAGYVTSDANGNIYVDDIQAAGYIDVYDQPVNGAASPSYTISNNAVGSTGLEDPFGIAIAPNGDLYASDTADVNQFTPPFTSSSVPSASVSGNQNNYGLAVDSSNRVFVENYSSNGVVNVFTQPFTNTSTPSFLISVSTGYLTDLAFDGSGNLWLVDQNGVLWEIAAPITSSSTATQVLTGTHGWGITFGP